MVCVRERHYGCVWYVCGGEINNSTIAICGEEITVVLYV